METCKIYLSGAMGSLTHEESIRWRNQICDAIKYGEYDINKKVVFFNPPFFYSIEYSENLNQKEVMNYDLNNLRNSNLVILNLNKVNSSIGTAMELMLAMELHIPIVAYGKKDTELHPWIELSIDKQLDSMRELVDYVVKYYLW